LRIVGWCNNDFDVPFFLYQNRGFREKDVSYLYTLLFNRKRSSVIAKPRVRKGHGYPKEYAIHFIHPSPAGHGALAEHLEARLDEFGWLKLDR